MMLRIHNKMIVKNRLFNNRKVKIHKISLMNKYKLIINRVFQKQNSTLKLFNKKQNNNNKSMIKIMNQNSSLKIKTKLIQI